MAEWAAGSHASSGDSTPSREALAAFIDRSPWGRQLSASERGRVLPTIRAASFERGEAVVRAGFPAEHWVGVIEGLGAQSVTTADGQVMHLSAGLEGSWFGEGTLIKGGRWGYDAIAIRHTRVALVPLATFRWLRETNLPFNHFIQRLLNERLAAFISLAVSSRTGTPVDRIASALLHLASANQAGHPEALIRMSQAELGLLAGISRQRTNEALRELRARGLVVVHRLGFAVPDMKALERALMTAR